MFHNIHSNISRLEACDATGIVVYSCVIASSITPSCSDESTSYHLVSMESRFQLHGGMARVFCGIPGYRVVNICDNGFK